MPRHVAASRIRSLFSAAMSAMYRSEVPKYGRLLELTTEVNLRTLEADPALRQALRQAGELDRLDVERHGAVRLGTPEELATMRRLVAVMGMRPVGYYDLSSAGVPVHSTAFRPVDEDELRQNPFRLFTSLLRPELIADEALRRGALELLGSRQIFTPGALALIERYEAEGGLTEEEAETFVREAIETFRWHGRVRVSRAQYEALLSAHRLIADITCFPGPHINHLTPRTLDIDAVQRAMPEWEITPKEVIEGPPRRNCPVLLRQTSFKALTETIAFAGEDAGASGSHAARFGEIEQRGVALTPAGRALYDQLLASHLAAGPGASLEAAFATLPDDHDSLRRAGLAWYRYVPTENGAVQAKALGSTDAEALLAAGCLRCEPLTYEDFLPVSAAGIFQSNLGEGERGAGFATGNRGAFEAALGAEVMDEMRLYEAAQQESLDASAKALGVAALTRAKPSNLAA
ncbi:2-oxoadipate dioxygenase/decarboxylase HglS [Roseomonas xinghualingensis]|uniref:2-oxoadipate dioxygenase/decarboxylase HglS n=1 Tax=Roseomonas xinghualingensis TaxID=2986475 RepID=UPI00366E68FF|nr:VOC family protein [Roseomonas sp. SXEYE001]